MQETFSDFIGNAEVTIQADGLYTVHCNGIGNPGKIYNCDGATEFEAKESAWRYIKTLEQVLGL